VFRWIDETPCGDGEVEVLLMRLLGFSVFEDGALRWLKSCFSLRQQGTYVLLWYQSAATRSALIPLDLEVLVSVESLHCVIEQIRHFSLMFLEMQHHAVYGCVFFF
jgi:hypothetical protein